MNTDLKPTSEVLEVFETIQHIFMQEMKDVISEFAEDILIKVDDRYNIHSESKQSRYIIIENRISLRRSNKTLLFRLFETRDLKGKDINIANAGSISYYIYMYIHNSLEKSDYFKELSPLYYLETIGKGYVVKLFPEKYVAGKDGIDKNKICEYVCKYLKAAKILLSDHEIKRLLYDPTYWVHADPYNFF